MRLRRVLFVTLVAVGLVSFGAPSAQAVTVGYVKFVGTVFIGDGIASTCLDGSSTPPSVNPSKCEIQNPTNSATFTLSATGVGNMWNGPTKGVKKNTVEAGTFVVAANGSIRGTCESFRATFSGAILPAAPGGSCVNKSVKQWTVTGSLVLLRT